MSSDPAKQFYKENGEMIDRFWNWLFNQSSVFSQNLFKITESRYKQEQKRGFMHVTFPNLEVAFSSKELPFGWSTKIDSYPVCEKAVKEYDPETSFVVIGILMVDLENMIYNGCTIHKDAYKKRKGPSREPVLLTEASPEVQKRIRETFRSGCHHCGKKEIDVKCLVCRVAIYCSAECKKAAKPAHKEKCKIFALNKTAWK